MTNRYKLSSGVEVIIEYMPHCRSVSTGIWAKMGSVWEQEKLAGISHFLEHMLFKGTAKRSAKDIAATMDSVGGIINAFTGKEYTCFYTRCLDEDWHLAIDLLADIYLNSQIAEADFNMEKNVIIEEINMYEDTPDDLVNDLFTSTLWAGHPYGRPVIGTKETVQNIDAAAMQTFYQQSYVPANTVIAIVGHIEPAKVIATLEQYFGQFAGKQAAIALSNSVPPASGGSVFINKDIEQVHVCLGFNGIDENDDDYYGAHLLTNILGGGMSSRLFQEVREKRGLSYSAYAYLSNYAKAGYFCCYASTRPQNLNELAQVMANEIAASGNISAEELNSAKQQLKGALLLGLENTGTMMNKLGKTLLTRNKIYDLNDTLAKINAVTMEDIARIGQRIIKPEQALASIVGPVDEPLDLAKLWA